MGDQSQEQGLWASVLGGDEDAFAALYELHADRVYAYCVRRGAVEADACDVVAEVFLQLWRQRERIEFDSARGLLPWLFTVAGRLLRRAVRAPAPIVTGPHEPDVALTVLAREQQSRMWRLLAELDPVDRQLAIDLWVHEYTSSHIARSQGVAAGTVRWRAHRLRRRLQQAWMASGGDELNG